MRITERVSNLIKKLLCHLFYLGHSGKKIVIYKINKDVRFAVRVNTIDKAVVWEVWKMKAYTDSKFKIKPTDIVVDIGAHIGSFSVYAAKKATNGKVYAYEPNKDNYEILLRNKTINNINNLHTFNTAVSDKVGTIDLYLGKSHNAMHSVYETDTKKKIKVPTITIKEILKRNKLKKIDVLKIDTEGAEYDIILNMPPKVFEKVDNILMEYHDYLNHHYNYTHLKRHLEKNGFKVTVHGSVIQKRILKEGVIKAKRITKV